MSAFQPKQKQPPQRTASTTAGPRTPVRSSNQHCVLMPLNRSKHKRVFVPEVSVRNAETIYKSLLAKHALGNSPRGFGQRHAITLPKSIFQTGLNQSLSNSASRKLSINPQHEQVQVLAGQNCRPFPELFIKCL